MCSQDSGDARLPQGQAGLRVRGKLSVNALWCHPSFPLHPSQFSQEPPSQRGGPWGEVRQRMLHLQLHLLIRWPAAAGQRERSQSLSPHLGGEEREGQHKEAGSQSCGRPLQSQHCFSPRNCLPAWDGTGRGGLELGFELEGGSHSFLFSLLQPKGHHHRASPWFLAGASGFGPGPRGPLAITSDSRFSTAAQSQLGLKRGTSQGLFIHPKQRSTASPS